MEQSIFKTKMYNISDILYWQWDYYNIGNCTTAKKNRPWARIRVLSCLPTTSPSQSTLITRSGNKMLRELMAIPWLGKTCTIKTRFRVKALAHYNWNYKKVVIVHTHYNFFSQLQRFFQQFYIWAKIFATIFLEKLL